MTDSIYEKWLDLYGDLYEDPSLQAKTSCLNCQQSGHLEMVFVVREGDQTSCRAYFWCANCMMGIGPLRAPIPESGWPLTPKGMERIPNYSLVYDEE